MSNDSQPQEGNVSEPEGSVARAIAKYLEGDNSELGSMVFALHAQLLEKARDKLRRAPNLQSVTDAEGAYRVPWEVFGGQWMTGNIAT